MDPRRNWNLTTRGPLDCKGQFKARAGKTARQLGNHCLPNPDSIGEIGLANTRLLEVGAEDVHR